MHKKQTTNVETPSSNRGRDPSGRGHLSGPGDAPRLLPPGGRDPLPGARPTASCPAHAAARRRRLPQGREGPGERERAPSPRGLQARGLLCSAEGSGAERSGVELRREKQPRTGPGRRSRENPSAAPRRTKRRAPGGGRPSPTPGGRPRQRGGRGRGGDCPPPAANLLRLMAAAGNRGDPDPCAAAPPPRPGSAERYHDPARAAPAPPPPCRGEGRGGHVCAQGTTPAEGRGRGDPPHGAAVGGERGSSEGGGAGGFTFSHFLLQEAGRGSDVIGAPGTAPFPCLAGRGHRVTAGGGVTEGVPSRAGARSLAPSRHLNQKQNQIK